MKKVSLLEDGLALNVRVGDLVRHSLDNDMKLGCGLVLSIERGSEDIFDLFEGLDIFVGKPKLEVIWFATKNSVWMEADEIKLI